MISRSARSHLQQHCFMNVMMSFILNPKAINKFFFQWTNSKPLLAEMDIMSLISFMTEQLSIPVSRPFFEADRQLRRCQGWLALSYIDWNGPLAPKKWLVMLVEVTRPHSIVECTIGRAHKHNALVRHWLNINMIVNALTGKQMRWEVSIW